MNYPARAAGIKRHHKVAEAKQMCPALVLVHVETIGDDVDDDDEEDEGVGVGGGEGGGSGGGGAGGVGGAGTRALSSAEEAERRQVMNVAGGSHRPQSAGGAAPDRVNRKVTLQRYRHASVDIMAALAKVAPCIERASIDEAYVDVTAQVDAVLRKQALALAQGGGGDDDDDNADGLKTDGGEDADTNMGSNADNAAAADGARGRGRGYEAMKPPQTAEKAVARGLAASGPGPGEVDPATSDLDRRLAIGAEVCARLRAAVFACTGYTMSGGVAHNKMLAKLASARNKPNKQTIVSWRAVGRG